MFRSIKLRSVLLVFTLVAVVAIVLAVGRGAFSSRVIVHNAGEVAIEDLVITNGMQSYSVEYVGSGWTIEYHPPLMTDGGIEISYVQDGVAMSHVLKGYLVYAVFFRCEATISEDQFEGECQEY